MRPDMRDELVERAIPAVFITSCVTESDDARTIASDVLDSIPPGSYKLDEKTWVRLDAKALARAMQRAWNDFCIDTGEFPDAFTLVGDEVRAEFAGTNFVHHIMECFKAEALYTEVGHAE